MGIIDRIFKTRRAALDDAGINPADVLEKERAADDKIKTVTVNTGKTISTGFNLGSINYEKEESNLHILAMYNVWAAASIRAITRNSITPILKIYNPVNNEDAENEPALALLRNPHPLFDYSRFMKYIISNRELYGDAYMYKIRMGNKIIGLQPLPSELVTLDTRALAAGRQQYIFNSGTRPITIDRADLVIWSDNEYAVNYYGGTSKLKHLLFTLQNKNNADRFNKAVFENGGEIKGVLSTDQALTRDDREYIMAEIKKRHGGADKAGKFMVLGGGLKWTGTGQTNSEMGFDLLNRATKEEVLAIYKTPPIELGLTETVNYSNAKEQRRLFWETCLIPMLDSFAMALTLDILKEQKSAYAFYYDYSAIPAMQIDLNQKLDSAMRMQLIGYDNDTIAEYLDLPDIDNEPETGAETGAEKTIKKAVPTEDTGRASGHGQGDFIAAFAPLPAHIKNIVRENAKTEFIKAHGNIEGQFKIMLQKYFLKWRNDLLDAIKGEPKKMMKKIGDPGALYAYLDERIEDAEAELEKIGLVMLSRAADDVAGRMIRLYNLEWTDSVNRQIIINNHTKRITLMVNETVDKQLRNRIRDAYTQGTLENFSVQDMANKFIDEVKDVYKMADKRAVLIARTETTAVSNDIMIDQFKENGINNLEWLTANDDKVRTIEDGAAFDHAAMDGVTTPVGIPFMVPGKDGAESMDYPGDMSKGSAGNVCNCFIPGTITEGNFLNVSKALYSGPVRKIITRGGKTLTVTINHPILTDKGWIPAANLIKGMNAVAYGPNIRGTFLTNPNNQNSPAMIENIFNSITSYGTPRHVVIKALDFHGDAAFFQNSEIDIISINRELPCDFQTIIRKQAGDDLDLIKPGASFAFISNKSASDKTGAGIVTFTPCDPCFPDLTFNQHGILFDFGPFKTLGIGAAANWYTGMGEASKQEGATISGFLRELFKRATGQIMLDEIVEIRDDNFNGHVYNLQSIDDYIISNGIVSSNCRCTLQPADDE